MRPNNDYKSFVTGNLGKSKKGVNSPNNGIMARANSASAKTTKVMKRDKGH